MSRLPLSIGGGESVSTSASEASPPSLVSPFKPKVLQQILHYVYPANVVVCLTAQWHFRLVASQQVHHQLAVPKNGALVLKYPLCFANKDDLRYVGGSYRYTNLIKHHICAKYPVEQRIVEEFQKFLAGYEAMMLYEIGLSAESYSDLSKLMIDFTLEDDSPLSTHGTVPAYIPGDQYRRLKLYHSGHNEFKDVKQSKELFMAWKLWSDTVATVINHCGASPEKFFFITPDQSAKLGLPQQFYSTLKLDEMLAKMRSLQVLYFPAFRTFENEVTASKKSKGQALSSRQQVWKALHELPENERLPSLRRVVVNDWRDLIGIKVSGSSGEGVAIRTRVCGLPSFAKAENAVTVNAIALDDENQPTPADLARLVFRSATIVPETIHVKSPVVIEGAKNAELEICYSGDFITFVDESNPMALFADKVNMVPLEVLVAHVKRLRDAKKQITSMCAKKMLVVLQCGRQSYHPDATVGKKDWCASMRRILAESGAFPARFNIILDVGRASGLNEPNGRLFARGILPLFAVDSRDALPASALAACSMIIKAKLVPNLTAIVNNWQLVAADGNCLQYKFPSISLHIEYERWSWDNRRQWPALFENFYQGNLEYDDDLTNDDERKRELVNAILDGLNDRITKKIDSFLQDAVSAYRRRDLASYLYQSLVHCSFVFAFKVLERTPNAVERNILGMVDTAWKARMKDFETLLMEKIFGGCVDDDCAGKYALAMPALKSFETYVQLQYDGAPEQRN